MIIRSGPISEIGNKRRFVAKASTALDKWATLEPVVTDPDEDPDPEEPIPDPLPPEVITPQPTPTPYARFKLVPSMRSVSTESDPTQIIVQDRIYSDTITALLYSDFNVVITTNLPIGGLVLSIENPEVATIEGLKITFQSVGTTVIKAHYNGVEMASTEFVTYQWTGATTRTFVGFVEGSLVYHCESNINSRISGATAAMLPIFSTQNHSGQVYTRNPNCWIYDLRQQTTCFSPWNSTGGNTRAGVAVTPRHILFAAHYEIAEGATVRFITADNQVINRTMVKRLRHPSYNAALYFPDLTIGVLDADLPESITPCRVLPSNYATYFPTNALYIAALCLDQQEKALVTDVNRLDSSYASFVYPNLPYEKILYEDKIVGDSGNPAFIVIEVEGVTYFALLTCWTYGGAGSGTFVTPQTAAINQMITDVDTLAGISTGYTLTPVDLSSFPTTFD